MKNGDLKIVRVYTQDGKQVAFDVQNAAGTQRVDKTTVVGAIKNGHSYVNATVSSSGVVRVDSDVPRQPMQRNKLKVQAILYSPYSEREGALGALVKCGDAVKACTYDEFCSTVSNYECDLDDREAVVRFNPRESFKNGYKYIDISKKDFLKSKVYEMSTPALKAVVDKIQSSRGSIKSQGNNPEIHYPFEMRVLGENIKIGYYDTPNNLKPVDFRIEKIPYPLSEDDDYVYFSLGNYTYYIRLDYKHIDNDDYMTDMTLNALKMFYGHLSNAIYQESKHAFEDHYRRILDDLLKYPYQYPQALLGDHEKYGIHIHNMVPPFDAIGAGNGSYGDCVFRTKYAYDKIRTPYRNCMHAINDIATDKY